MGQPRPISQDTAYTPIRFPGQHSDPETGFHYKVRRYYDPETARYASPDPLGLGPASKPITYVVNPHAWIDPPGLTPCIVYRNLRPDEDPRLGLDAKNPNATYTPAGHVLNGSRPNWASQYTSTTASHTVALDSQRRPLMQDHASAALADAWQKFDTPLRMRKGFDEDAYTALTSALQACADAWASQDAIPKLGANILVDIFSATEGNIALYEDDAAQRVTEAAFELQDLVGQCVALDAEPA